MLAVYHIVSILFPEGDVEQELLLLW